MLSKLRNIAIACPTFLFLTLVCCQQTASVAPPPATPEIIDNNKDDVCSIPDYTNRDWHQIWRRFSSATPTTLAGPNDFRFPNAGTSQDLGFEADLNQWRTCPVISGDFDHDGDSRDYALIVINKTTEADERYSLLILSSRLSNHYKDRVESQTLVHSDDLSHDYLSKSRGGLSLIRLDATSSIRVCKVLWNDDINSFECK